MAGVGHAHDPPPGGLLPGGGGPVSPGPRRDPHCVTSGPGRRHDPRPRSFAAALARQPAGALKEKPKFPEVAAVRERSGKGGAAMKVDPRGQRFAAALSALVLVLVLITSSAWLLGAQAAVFGIGAVFGLRYAPYGLIFRWLVRPRLGPPRELEDEAPPRFSQWVGLVISVVGVIGYATGLTLLGIVAAALALAAA